MNSIGIGIAALMGWQKGKELLAEMDEKFIKQFRLYVIITIFGYAIFCGVAAKFEWHTAPSIAWILVVLLGGLWISSSWQGLAAIAGLSAATKSLTPLKVIGYMALVFAIPTAVSEALMLGAITKPVMLFPLYVAGTVAGIYPLLFGGGVWFKRVVVISVVFLAGKALVGMYYEQAEATKVAEELLAQNKKQLDKNDAAYIAKKGGFATAAAKGELSPEQERKLRFAKNGAPVLQRVTSYAEERLGVVSVSYDIPRSVSPKGLLAAKKHRICGIPQGQYRFEVVGNPLLPFVEFLGDGNIKRRSTPIKQGNLLAERIDALQLPLVIPYAVLMNGVPDGGSIAIGENGCGESSFNLTPAHEEMFDNGTLVVTPTTVNLKLTPE